MMMLRVEGKCGKEWLIFCSHCLECENSDFSQATAQEKVSHDSSGMGLSCVEYVFVRTFLDLLKILVLIEENEFDYS